MLIDTHCHLDAREFEADRCDLIAKAQAAGVSGIIIPAVELQNFEIVRELAHSFQEGYYALGIHPMYVKQAKRSDLAVLREKIIHHRDDPKLVAVGEIGLDFFVADIASGAARQEQEYFYEAQLSLAREFNLPVLLHVRRSQDTILKYLRKYRKIGGCAHAFNGSMQQALQFIELGFCLGIGGAMTYPRALQIRRLAMTIPLHNLVLETDAPDIAPSWLIEDRRNTPDQVLGVAQSLADLRQVSVAQIIEQSGKNVLRLFPKMSGHQPRTN